MEKKKKTPEIPRFTLDELIELLEKRQSDLFSRCPGTIQEEYLSMESVLENSLYYLQLFRSSVHSLEHMHNSCLKYQLTSMSSSTTIQ